MIKTLAFFTLALPLLSSAAVVYDFSYPIANGTVGFGLVSDNYLTGTSYQFSASQLSSCDVSGVPANWTCQNVYLNSNQSIANGYVQVTLGLIDLSSYPDAFSTDQITTGFPGARLTADGNYQSQLDPGATLMVRNFPGSPKDVAAPEPSTWGLFAIVGGGLALLRYRRRTAIVERTD